MSANEDKHLKGYWMGAALIALLLFAYYAITWRNAYNFRAAMDVRAQPFWDFATFYYPMGKAIFQMKLPIGLLGSLIEYRRKT